ncbi:MAG: VRR-NUC domain-containing protein [bacterium]|nr:VRR-NUC domain-containing protein [bacterium]
MAKIGSAVTRPLPEGYYVDNFELLLKTVTERYRDLLLDEELGFCRDFDGLSVAAKRLYVRLISRKGPHFRRDRLVYDEISSLEAATVDLEAAGFVDRAPEVDPEKLLPLLLRAELAEAAVALAPDSVPPAARKDELMRVLAGSVDSGGLRRAIDKRIDVVRVRHLEQVVVFRLLFFGNLSQDWTELVLRDLGVVRYENYELRSDLRLFPTRRALDDSLLMRGYRNTVSGCLAAGEIERALELAGEVLAGIDRWHPSVRRLVDHVLNEAGRFLERRGDDSKALAFYEQATAPPARERRARVLARRGSIAEALALCEEIRSAPRDETEVAFARAFTHRLRRMRGEPLRPRKRRRRPFVQLAVRRRDGEPIERLALETLEADGRRGFFSENWLWKSLFGLAFWDVVFAAVEGAFQHPFQLGPLDLDSPDFRAVRAEAIDRRMHELRAERRPGPWLMEVYEAKQGVANRLVTWHEGSRDYLELALSCLAGEQLATVCDRLSRDLKRYRRGFPDLFLLRDDEPGFELYEVKGPGDQLRPEQKAWIDYLNDSGIPASILQVTWRTP